MTVLLTSVVSCCCSCAQVDRSKGEVPSGVTVESGPITPSRAKSYSPAKSEQLVLKNKYADDSLGDTVSEKQTSLTDPTHPPPYLPLAHCKTESVQPQTCHTLTVVDVTSSSHSDTRGLHASRLPRDHVHGHQNLALE